eukprot:1855889-Rhodomonas_salina.3
MPDARCQMPRPRTYRDDGEDEGMEDASEGFEAPDEADEAERAEDAEGEDAGDSREDEGDDGNRDHDKVEPVPGSENCRERHRQDGCDGARSEQAGAEAKRKSTASASKA